MINGFHNGQCGKPWLPSTGKSHGQTQGMLWLPSGKRLHSELQKSPCCNWVNQLFRHFEWLYELTKWHKNHIAISYELYGSYDSYVM